MSTNQEFKFTNFLTEYYLKKQNIQVHWGSEYQTSQVFRRFSIEIGYLWGVFCLTKNTYSQLHSFCAMFIQTLLYLFFTY